MRLGILGLLVLLFGTGCLVEKRTLMSGWHVERMHRAEYAAQPENPFELRAEQTPDVEPPSRGVPPAFAQAEAAQLRRGYMHVIPLQKLEPLPDNVTTKELKRSQTRISAGIEIDRPTSVTLITLGAAALMWGYTSFSFLGWAIVFLASIVAAPLVHALIWGERMSWETSRLDRIALSLVVSGLLLSGAMALIANLFGWVF